MRPFAETRRPTTRRSAPFGLLALFVVAGCGGEEVAQLYRAERDLHNARRSSERLSINPDLAGRQEFLHLADRYRGVGEMYADAAGAEPDSVSETLRTIARYGAHAKLVAAQLYLRAEEPTTAERIALEVRDRMAWAQEVAVAAQVQLIESIRRSAEPERIVEEFWLLADSYSPVVSDGDEVRSPVFNAPINVVRFLESRQDTTAAKAAAGRALGYYAAVAERWPNKIPALLADLNRATLLDAKGDWQGSASLLAEILESFPEEILRPAEAARIAYTLGRIRIAGERDVPGALDAFARAMELAPGSEGAADAAMALGTLHADAGRLDEAIALFRRVAKEHEDDMDRAPAARFGLAGLLEEAGRWEQAMRELRALEASYPRSRQALEAPFAVASHYRQAGETELAARVLADAEKKLREMIDDGGTTESFVFHQLLFRSLVERHRWEETIREMTAFSRAYEGAPEAAAVLLDAADIAASRLNDNHRAGDLLREIETTYPNTVFAREAVHRLGEIGS